MKQFLAPAILLMSFLSFVMYAQEIPEPTGFVNDLANVISEEIEANLEELLAQMSDLNQAQIAVLTIDSLNGGDIFDYSFRVAESWGIGDAELDKGLLLLVAIEDRKLRIEVGYGLEGIIPDAIASRIIRNEITPHFAEGNYEDGISAGILEITQVILGVSKYSIEDIAEDNTQTEGSRPQNFVNENNVKIVAIVISVLLVLILIVLVEKKRTGENTWVVIGKIISWLFVFLFQLIIAILIGMVTGGGSSSGRRGGGSSSSRSFGGFGGGSFGGGGASGSW